MNILFTSVGRRVELLRAFRAAYENLGITGRIVAVDSDPLAPALRVADAAYVVPLMDAPEHLGVLLEILAREDVSAVFPLIDPDVPALADHRELIEATGARVATVRSEAVEITVDKWRTNEFFRSLGLAAAASWLPGELDPAAAGYPLFVKPRFGSASGESFKAETPEQLTFFSRYVPTAIVQEYLVGPEITSDVVCDLEGEVLAVVSRERIRVRAGEVSIGKTVFDPAIAEACVRIAEALPAVGPITVQCIVDRGVPTFTEINARLGGGAPCGVAAGADWPRWLLARLAGMPVEIPPLGSYQTGLYFSRCDESFYLSEAEVEQLASRRVRPRRHALPGIGVRTQRDVRCRRVGS